MINNLISQSNGGAWMQQPRQNWAYDFCCKLFSCNGSASTGKIASGFNLPLAANRLAALATSCLNLGGPYKLARCNLQVACKLICSKSPYCMGHTPCQQYSAVKISKQVKTISKYPRSNPNHFYRFQRFKLEPIVKNDYTIWFVLF